MFYSFLFLFFAILKTELTMDIGAGRILLSVSDLLTNPVEPEIPQFQEASMLM